ncbi:MAG: DUF58 domain-containing protein [bacterium]
MISKDLIQKIKQIDIKSKYLATEIFAGEYESAFRGRGMEFEEVREYQVGDDVRTIDWNVTARMGHPFIKVFREERELSVMFLVDASASQDFGTRGKLKREMAAEVAALLAYAATKSNDKVGLITFTDRVEKYIPPKKGTGHIWRVIKEILTFKPVERGTSLQGALEFLVNVLPRRVVCFLISDFLTQNFDKGLGIAARRHDLIALSLSDPAEEEIPSLGWVRLHDSETGKEEWVDTRSKEFRAKFKEDRLNQLNQLFSRFQSLGIDACRLETSQDYVNPLLKLFRMREKRH